MLIFKTPSFEVCTCERCGTVFQPEAGDNLEYRFADPAQFENLEVFTHCPTCYKYCAVTVKVATDKNDDSKRKEQA